MEKVKALTKRGEKQNKLRRKITNKTHENTPRNEFAKLVIAKKQERTKQVIQKQEGEGRAPGGRTEEECLAEG